MYGEVFLYNEMNPTLKDKISQTLRKYDDYKNQLANAGMNFEAAKMRDMTKEYHQLSLIVEKINRISQLEKLISDTNTILVKEKNSELIDMAKTDLADYQKEYETKLNEIQEELYPKNPLDNKSVIMEIRAGTGGDESALFGAVLYRMYSRFCERKKWDMKILSSNRTGVGGFKEIVFEINGKGVYGALKYESGTHRVQRIPETEKSGRIHTSAATVAVLPQADEVDVEIKPGDIKIDVFRAGGHGGQSVNTTDSAVRITHIPTQTIVTCQDERSQLQNKIKALTVLRSRILANREQKRVDEIQKTRKNQIGTGDRSEKIRTFNYPQDRITDHRIKKNWHNIQDVLDGNLDDIINDLKKSEKITEA